MNPIIDLKVGLDKIESVVADLGRQLSMARNQLRVERHITSSLRRILARERQMAGEKVAELASLRSEHEKLTTLYVESRQQWYDSQKEIAQLKAGNENPRLAMMLEEDKRRASLMDDCINPKVPSSLGSWLKEETCQTGSAFRRNIDGQTHVEGHNCPSC